MGSGHSRWADTSNFASDWDERSRLIAEMIPAGSRVLDIGAGRQQLRGFLDPSSFYVGSDVVARDAAMLVIDLNARPLPTLRQFRFDVAVLAGVIEYVSQVGARELPVLHSVLWMRQAASRRDPAPTKLGARELRLGKFLYGRGARFALRFCRISIARDRRLEDSGWRRAHSALPTRKGADRRLVTAANARRNRSKSPTAAREPVRRPLHRRQQQMWSKAG
jgi:hypothetical protein